VEGWGVARSPGRFGGGVGADVRGGRAAGIARRARPGVRRRMTPGPKARERAGRGPRPRSAAGAALGGAFDDAAVTVAEELAVADLVAGEDDGVAPLVADGAEGLGGEGEAPLLLGEVAEFGDRGRGPRGGVRV